MGNICQEWIDLIWLKPWNPTNLSISETCELFMSWVLILPSLINSLLLVSASFNSKIVRTQQLVWEHVQDRFRIYDLLESEACPVQRGCKVDVNLLFNERFKDLTGCEFRRILSAIYWPVLEIFRTIRVRILGKFPSWLHGLSQFFSSPRIDSSIFTRYWLAPCELCLWCSEWIAISLALFFILGRWPSC